ncbi:MAG: phosphohistidine phosphatase SixA [Burkholderiales bacterium]|nr:phosphohistidine phosphatase SixA [Burkholderiales bacterium]
MDLILWRHAQAQLLSASAPSDDLARQLTGKGERQAERMAAWLNQRLPEMTRILVSPAQRTQQTARALGRSFKTVESIAPGGCVDELLQAARWPKARDPVLLVGHQPTLGMLAARLLTGQDLSWSIRKGAVWWLRGTERDGVLEVVLQAVQSPDFL